MEEVKKEEVKKISHEKWDAMLDRITHNDHPITGWFPTMDDALELTLNPVEHYEFIIWILESNPNLELNEEQKEVYKVLQDALRDCTEFTD